MSKRKLFGFGRGAAPQAQIRGVFVWTSRGNKLFSLLCLKPPKKVVQLFAARPEDGFRRRCRISFRANSNVVGQKSQLPTPSVAFSNATVGPRFGQGAAARSLLGRDPGRPRCEPALGPSLPLPFKTPESTHQPRPNSNLIPFQTAVVCASSGGSDQRVTR